MYSYAIGITLNILELVLFITGAYYTVVALFSLFSARRIPREAKPVRFAAVVPSSEVAHAKPAPDVFLEAARRLGTEPARTMVLEDSFNGVRAGAAGGFFTVMVPDLARPDDEIRSVASRVCSSLLEVRDLLAQGAMG